MARISFEGGKVTVVSNSGFSANTQLSQPATTGTITHVPSSSGSQGSSGSSGSSNSSGSSSSSGGGNNSGSK